MKVLKIVLIVLGVLVLVGIILGLTGPKTYQVERSTVIAASPDIVWPYTSSAKAFQEWSPFRKMDTTATVEYFGTDGTVGSGYKWKGKDAGKGESTYTTLEPGKSAISHLKFYMPMMVMESDAYMYTEPDPGGTKLTWGFKGENNFIGRIMMSMGNMEKQMGPIFDQGLADLQALIASRSAAVPASNYQIGMGQFPGRKYLGVRGDVKMTDITAFYSTNLGKVMSSLENAGAKMDGMPTGLYYTWDEDKGMTNMVAAIGVTGDVKAPAGMEVIDVPAGKAVVLDYNGGYNGLYNAHMAMENYLKSNNLTSNPPVIEEYITDPGMEPDSMKWVTKITYLVK